jgi:uncharacterized NAD(P)/FAD-binding protein YdhS
MHTIAIVGCGATGVSLLAQLVDGLREAPNTLRIIIFEKTDLLGPGLAYSCHPDLMMNSPAGIVTVFDKDNHHFLRWLASSRDKWASLYPDIACFTEFDPEWFSPRALVGIYLHEMFLTYRQMAIEKGVIFEVLKEEVIGIDESNGMFISFSFSVCFSPKIF